MSKSTASSVAGLDSWNATFILPKSALYVKYTSIGVVLAASSTSARVSSS